MKTATQPRPDTNTNTVKVRHNPLVFFDGVCGLCNSTVDFLLKHDRYAHFRFAPLQGETARAELNAEDTQHLDSIVFRDRGQTSRHSSAVTRILWQLGGWWSLAGAMLWLVPWPIRHLGYKVVAAVRYSAFGKKESCRLPTPEERDRFLP